MRFSRPATDDPLPWFTLALHTVAGASPMDVIADDMDWGCQPDRHPSKLTAHYPGGIGAHPFTEFCIALDGYAVLNISERAFEMSPPRWAVLSPGRNHVEAHVRPDRAYTLMWVSAKGELATMGVSRYQPGKGWSIHARSHLRDVVVSHLTTLTQHPEEWTKRDGFERLRQALLTVLCAMQVKAYERSIAVRKPGHPDGRHADMIEHVRQMLQDDLHAELSVAQLAELARMTPNYLNTLFRRQVGRSIHAYRQAHRMEEARRLLASTNLLAKEVAMRLGFADPLYFSRAYHRHFGTYPTAPEKGV